MELFLDSPGKLGDGIGREVGQKLPLFRVCQQSPGESVTRARRARQELGDEHDAFAQQDAVGCTYRVRIVVGDDGAQQRAGLAVPSQDRAGLLLSRLGAFAGV